MYKYVGETDDYEVWKSLNNYKDVVNGKYEVSNMGKVRIKDGWYRNSGKILGIKINKGGYVMVKLTTHNDYNKRFYLHRLVAEMFCENPRGVNSVDHIDNNKFNNKASNLQWLTNSENSRKKIKVGKSGIRNVFYDKGLYVMKYSNEDIGLKFTALFHNKESVIKFCKHNGFDLKGNTINKSIYSKGFGKPIKATYKNDYRDISISMSFGTQDICDRFIKHNEFEINKLILKNKKHNRQKGVIK